MKKIQNNAGIEVENFKLTHNKSRQEVESLFPSKPEPVVLVERLNNLLSGSQFKNCCGKGGCSFR